MGARNRYKFHLSFWRFSFPGGFGVLDPESSPFVLCRPEYGLFKLPKHYLLKGKWPILKHFDGFSPKFLEACFGELLHA